MKKKYNVKILTLNHYEVNTYLLINSSTHKSSIIDPGCYSKKDQTKILDTIDLFNIEIENIFITHTHLDHIVGIHFIKKLFPKSKLYIPEAEAQIIKTSEIQKAFTYGFEKYIYVDYDYNMLQDGDILNIHGLDFKIIEAPGHSVGHIALHCNEINTLFSGDIIFKNSIGRSDLPGGNKNLLIKNIRSKLFTLPKNTIIYPGHGDITTINEEIKYNPFFN